MHDNLKLFTNILSAISVSEAFNNFSLRQKMLRYQESGYITHCSSEITTSTSSLTHSVHITKKKEHQESKKITSISVPISLLLP